MTLERGVFSTPTPTRPSPPPSKSQWGQSRQAWRQAKRVEDIFCFYKRNCYWLILLASPSPLLQETPPLNAVLRDRPEYFKQRLAVVVLPLALAVRRVRENDVEAF